MNDKDSGQGSGNYAQPGYNYAGTIARGRLTPGLTSSARYLGTIYTCTMARVYSDIAPSTGQ